MAYGQPRKQVYPLFTGAYMNKTHAPSSISHVARCGLVLVPISSNQSQVTCGRCQRYFDSEKKGQKDERQVD